MPKFLAATSVVPEPANGSSTMFPYPFGTVSYTNFSINSNGLTVGWVLKSSKASRFIFSIILDWNPVSSFAWKSPTWYVVSVSI